VSVPVAVTNPVALYRRGLVASLIDAGFPAEEPEDVFRWAERPGLRAIILTLSGTADLEAVGALRDRRPELVVLVLLTDPTLQAYCSVLAAEAFPVAWDVPPAVIVSVLEAAIRGEVVLPQDVASRLAWGESEGEAPAEESLDLLPLGEAEVQILGRIARGDTDRKIASALQISERTVRRRLQLIFSKLGIETRVQAGIYAAQRGLVSRIGTNALGGETVRETPSQEARARGRAASYGSRGMATSVLEPPRKRLAPHTTTQLRAVNSEFIIRKVQVSHSEANDRPIWMSD